MKRYCSIKDSIIESLKQMKLIRNGNVDKKTWKELKMELKNKAENKAEDNKK